MISNDCAWQAWDHQPMCVKNREKIRQIEISWENQQTLGSSKTIHRFLGHPSFRRFMVRSPRRFPGSSGPRESTVGSANQRFPHEIWGFPVDFPLNQSIEHCVFGENQPRSLWVPSFLDTSRFRRTPRVTRKNRAERVTWLVKGMLRQGSFSNPMIFHLDNAKQPRCPGLNSYGLKFLHFSLFFPSLLADPKCLICIHFMTFPMAASLRQRWRWLPHDDTVMWVGAPVSVCFLESQSCFNVNGQNPGGLQTCESVDNWKSFLT